MKKKEVCKRICDVLMIDCFPDLNEKKYWILKNDKWESRNIFYSEDLLNINDAFDSKLTDLFARTESNVLFTTNECYVDGVIDFTNYENKEVFNALYQNIHVFERKLRLLLNSLNHNYEKFIDYYEHRIRNCKPKNLKFLEGKINTMKSEKFKKNSLKFKPLEKLDLRELIEYSISDFHNSEELTKIGLKNTRTKIHPDKLGDLRNTIMHSINVSGENIYISHNFTEFKNYFDAIQEFKEVFSLLAKSICKIGIENVDRQNKATIGMIDKMDDQTINNYFYSNF